MTRALIAKIHIAKKELGLDDDAYRDVLAGATGKRSASGMSERELIAVLNAFKKVGWEGGKATKPSRPMEAQERLARALWKDLAGRGITTDSEAAFSEFCKRQTGTSVMRWMSAEERNKVVEGLKAWLGRERAKARKEASCPA